VKFHRIKDATPAIVDIENRHVEDKQGIIHSATAEDFASFVCRRACCSGSLSQPLR
jgi:hypothetical protein